jgi:hypothetical protein
MAKALPAVEPPPDLQPSRTVANVPADNVPPMSKATLAIASLLFMYFILFILVKLLPKILRKVF